MIYILLIVLYLIGYVWGVGNVFGTFNNEWCILNWYEKHYRFHVGQTYKEDAIFSYLFNILPIIPWFMSFYYRKKGGYPWQWPLKSNINYDKEFVRKIKNV